MLVGGAASNVQNLPIEAESGVGRWWKVQLRSWTAAEGGFKLWNQPNQMQFQPKEQIQTEKRKILHKNK